jgi:hypothetical protein
MISALGMFGTKKSFKDASLVFVVIQTPPMPVYSNASVLLTHLETKATRELKASAATALLELEAAATGETTSALPEHELLAAER